VAAAARQPGGTLMLRSDKLTPAELADEVMARGTGLTLAAPLYWRDRNLRFHRYDQLEPSPDIDDLLTEIDRDPTAIFWG